MISAVKIPPRTPWTPWTDRELDNLVDKFRDERERVYTREQIASMLGSPYQDRVGALFEFTRLVKEWRK